MTKDIIIDTTNSTVRIPSEFTRKFKKSKQHRKLKAKMIYDESNICTKESLIIIIDKKQ